MNLIKKFMASSERVYVVILIFSVLTLVVNLAPLMSQEKTRAYVDHLEQRIVAVENMLKGQQVGP